jgi:ABC-2 type transport system permease protein
VPLTFSFVQPLIWMLFFGFLFHRFDLGSGVGTRSYLDFLAPGVSVMTVLLGASQAGIGYIRDLQTGFLQRLLLLPASRHVHLVGKLSADVLRLLIQGLIVLGLASLLGADLRFDLGAWVSAILGLGLFGWAFSCISAAIALRTRAQESMAAFVHVINMPLLFTSTALVPIRLMPDWLATLAAFNPLTLAVDGWRNALLFSQPTSLRQLLPLAILALIAYLWSFYELGRVETS